MKNPIKADMAQTRTEAVPASPATGPIETRTSTGTPEVIARPSLVLTPSERGRLVTRVTSWLALGRPAPAATGGFRAWPPAPRVRQPARRTLVRQSAL